MSVQPSATLQLNHLTARHPPLVTLSLAVMLLNPTARAYWFLIPDQVPRTDNHLSAYALDTLRLRDHPETIAGHFRGSGGFYAFHLPADTTLSLTALPLTTDTEQTDSVIVSLLVADDLSPQDAGLWFNPQQTISDIAAGVPDSEIAIVHKQRTSDLSEVTFQPQSPQQLDLTISLQSLQ